MKKTTLFRVGFIAAGVAVGLGFGLYTVSQRLDKLEAARDRLGFDQKRGLVPALYVSKKTGEPLFFSGDLVAESGGKLCFSAPCHPDCVEYVADLKTPGGRVDFAAAGDSDKDPLGYVKEKPDGSFLYMVDAAALRRLPFQGYEG